MTISNNKSVSVHTGFPNPATDTRLEGLSLSQLLIAHPVSTFFIRIQGHQWENQGIFDGDIAIVDRALNPRGTDLTIWWQDDNFAVSKYQAILKEREVWGVITAIIHQYRIP